MKLYKPQQSARILIGVLEAFLLICDAIGRAQLWFDSQKSGQSASLPFPKKFTILGACIAVIHVPILKRLFNLSYQVSGSFRLLLVSIIFDQLSAQLESIPV